jgi:hypothetical protein
MRRLALGILLTPTLLACFHGDATLGSICHEDADCGAEQTCENEVCGLCGDGVAQPGELCSVPAEELASAPRLSAGMLLAFDRGQDGLIELMVRGEDGMVEQWQGDGEGGFTVATRVAEGGRAGPVRLAELDEDETIDLVVVDAEARTLALGYGDAEGGWSLEPTVALGGVPSDLAVSSAWGEGPAWVAWADERGLWLASVELEARLLGESVQLTQARAQWLGEPVALDDDMALDLFVVDVDGMRLEPWLGDGEGGLVQGESLELEGHATDLVTLDVDGDGDADVLVPDEEGGITVIVDAGGGLAVVGRVIAPGPVRGLTVADLDRDVARDLVVAVDRESPLWLLPLRSGWYPDSIKFPVSGAVGAVRTVDVDRDGLAELLLGPSEGVGPLRVVEVAP